MMFNRVISAGIALTCLGLCGGQILAQNASLQGTPRVMQFGLRYAF